MARGGGRDRAVAVGAVALAAGAAAAAASWDGWPVSFEEFVRHRELLASAVASRPFPAALLYLLLVVSTAFFLPGAIVLTVAGGALFGLGRGVALCVGGFVLGATGAFLLARHAFGRALQQRHAERFRGFNEELARHGVHYLLALRVIPAMPFFLTNYLAGLTRLRTRTFVWTTAAGMLPGTVAYCFAGSEIAGVDAPGQLLSPRVAASLALVGVLALLPPLWRHGRRLLAGRGARGGR